MEGGIRAMEHLLAANPKKMPTAVMCSNDMTAIGVLHKLYRAGLRVPDDLSVIGFDDAPIADLMALTTIRQPLADKGRTAATILLELIAGHSRRRAVMPTHLILRATTGPAPHR